MEIVSYIIYRLSDLIKKFKHIGFKQEIKIEIIRV